MRAVVRGRIGVFHLQGFLDGNNAPSFLTIDDIRATEALNIDMLLVSLKKVIFFNKNGLDTFVRLLTNIRIQKHIVVGFCDYDHSKFKAINTISRRIGRSSLSALRRSIPSHGKEIQTALPIQLAKCECSGPAMMLRGLLRLNLKLLDNC